MLTRRGLTSCALRGPRLCPRRGPARRNRPTGPDSRHQANSHADRRPRKFCHHRARRRDRAGRPGGAPTHPGLESAYAIEGGGVLNMDGQPDKTIGQGDSFQIPTRVAHAFQNGAKPTRLHITLVAETGKPLCSPA